MAVCFGAPAAAQMLTGYGQQKPEPEKVPAEAESVQAENLQVQNAQQTPAEEVAQNRLTSPVLTPVRQPAAKASNPVRTSKEPVDLQADKLVHDDEAQTVTATGNVMLVQSGRILRADEISYNLRDDTVIARGHVVLNEENGDIHYAEEVKLTDNFKDGFVVGLKSYLSDGARFWADSGERKDGTVTTMNDAFYTPCEVCEHEPDNDPVWQIRASEVTHDEQENRVSYRNARFEVYGVPVAYTPYFSHPDGTVKRKSGLLSPSAGYKSRLGAFVTNSYYWDIAPNKDATVSLTAMTKEAPLLTGQWRQRWQDAGMELSAGLTYSDRSDSEAGLEVVQDEEVRGHVLGEARWDMNEKWRSGVNIEWASDDQYMRQYDISTDDVLENEIYAERFSGRHYSVGRLLTFQDVRVREKQTDQPEVLPEVISSFIGEPGSVPVVGGRWNFEGSFLGLRREGDEQDMNRLSLNAGWQRRLVSDHGLLTRVSANARGDFYNTRDRDVATPGSGRSTESSGARLFPQLHVQTSYPVARPYEKMQAVIEPIAALTLAPNINVSEDIPNEDSQDVQIDASNIFESNRFPGLDRVEDQSRVTYGVRTGLYGYEGSYGDIFLGQSHRLEEDDNPFPEGSGLNKQESDVVGQITGRYGNVYDLAYRFQLASANLASQRHEIDASANWNRLQLNSRYLFAKALEGTDINESREQLQGDVGYYLTPEWRIRTGATQDFGDNPGLRKTYAGIDYFGQCVSWSLLGKRNLTENTSGDSDTEILFRIGLKNLGEYEESGWRPLEAKE